MTMRITAATAALAAFLAVGTALPAAADDDDDDRRCAGGASALSIPQVTDRLTQQGYRDITRIERDDGCYKVRATDAGGRRVRLVIDPSTGAIADRRERR